MSLGIKSFYAGTFLLIFSMMLIIGISSEVSLSASFTRAVLAAGLFTVLTGVICKVVSVCVFPCEQADDLGVEDEDLGTNVDITITESPDNSNQPEAVFTDVPSDNSEEFIPLSARQIDPQVSKIINSDPEKVAEIVRKMGFEEDE